MKITVISFTRAGAEKNLELVRLLQENNHQAASYSWHKYTGRKLIPFKSLKLLFCDLWDNQDAFIFLWDMERVARAVLPFLNQNGEGPAVIIMDEAGKFVIPFLKGSMKGTDAWCEWFAQLIDASAVITDGIREEKKFDVGAFARKNQLYIQDIFRIKTISTLLAQGGQAGIYSDYPVEGVLPEGLVGVGRVMAGENGPEGPVPESGISITDDWEAPRFAKECRMFPRNLVLGVVCSQGEDAAALEQFVLGVLTENHLSKERVGEVFSSHDLEQETAITALAQRLDIPYFTYAYDQLPADAVQSAKVCEACARLGSRNGKRLVDSRVKENMAVSVYEKKVELRFSL